MNTPTSSQPGKPSPSGRFDWRSPVFDPAEQDTSPLPAQFSGPMPASDPLDDAAWTAHDSAPASRARRQRKLARVIAPIVAVALLAGIVVVLLLPDSAATQPAIIQPNTSTNNGNQPDTGNLIQAYIVGAVVHPGVYSLHDGDRVDKLLQVAGGPAPKADLVRVNLAAPVTDGEEVFVPHVGEPFPAGLNNGGPGKININVASASDLHVLLGISTAIADKIVAYRHVHGPYTSIDQLLNVIDAATYNRIKNYITV